MFWRVASFSQPSPIDQILDKDEFTLEELLDEDDLIQECKSLNGRLVAFLRERSTVEQLLRFLVEPPKDLDDPKRTYKYPFTSCEVFCCELEAVFNTMLEDAELMSILFSLLDNPPPLSCKTAGYFGRVVNNLLLRKSSEMMQWFQDNVSALEKLVSHVDTTSVADVIKRIVGADEQCTSLTEPVYSQWLSEANLIDLLLAKLAHSSSLDAQSNAADILSAIANTQPSPLAVKLAKEESIACMFEHALMPEKQVMVSALQVCIALIEPHRITIEGESLELEESASPQPQADSQIKDEAVRAIVQHLPKLVTLLQTELTSSAIQTTYGVTANRLGLSRLKIVELMGVLIRSGGLQAEEAVLHAGAIPVCLDLFQAHPFNNLLHHNVASMLIAILTQSSEPFLQSLFEQYSFLDWLVSLPVNITTPEKEGDGQSSPSSSSVPIRAGYMGHATQVGGVVDSISQQGQPSSSRENQMFTFSSEVAHPAKVAEYAQGHAAWQKYSEEVLRPRLQLENTAHWSCGRPAAGELPGLDSDGDDMALQELDREQLSGMHPIYHRYNSMDDHDEDEDDEEEDESKAQQDAENLNSAEYEMTESGPAFTAMGLMSEDGDGVRIDDDGTPEKARAGESSSPERGQQQALDDDVVLLASSDDEEAFFGGDKGQASGGSPPPPKGSSAQGQSPTASSPAEAGGSAVEEV